MERFYTSRERCQKLRRNGRGEQLVIFNVVVPTKLTKNSAVDLRNGESLAQQLTAGKGILDWLSEALGG